jgi:hypothetical protein
MNIKKFTLLLLIFGFTNCKSQDKEDFKNVPFNKETFTLYEKNNNSFHVAKFVEIAKDSIGVYLYELNISTPEGLLQTFSSEEKITKSKINIKKKDLEKKYNWKVFNGQNVLFVQIQPNGFKNELEVLDKRQEIENDIDDALKSKNVGEWFAGDNGPGGGNMLFTITDTNQATKIVLDILSKNHLEKNTVIGKRVMTDKEDWFYEVIYPEKFTGKFNTM